LRGPMRGAEGRVLDSLAASASTSMQG
jgi:hypothetical protein